MLYFFLSLSNLKIGVSYVGSMLFVFGHFWRNSSLPVTVENLSNSFIPAENETHERLPVLDLSDFYSEDEKVKQAFIQAVGDALQKYGFFALTHHGIPDAKVDKALDSAKEFFTLSDPLKRKYENIALNRGYKGFQPARKDKIADLQEYWHVGREISQEQCQKLKIPVIQSNVWPENLKGFRENMLGLYETFENSGSAVLKACSLYMGEKEDFLESITENGDSIMRVIHYMESPQNAHPDKIWKAPHKDPNLLTMIAGISMEGLQIQRPDGSWMSVVSTPDMVIVSASNMLESLSNGLYKSTPHRVINQHNCSRYSIPFFYHVRRDVNIGPRESAINKTKGEALYPSITAEESLSKHNWFLKNKKN